MSEAASGRESPNLLESPSPPSSPLGIDQHDSPPPSLSQSSGQQSRPLSALVNEQQPASPKSQQLARRRSPSCEEPPAKVPRLLNDEEDDGQTCPICLETWGNSGEHRLVSLKCGHLFGASCVTRWLRAQAAKQRACPTCKSHAALRDVRHIFARRLLAADDSQLAALQARLQDAEAGRSRAELALQQAQAAHRACAAQRDEMRALLHTQESARTGTERAPAPRSWRFALERTLETGSAGGGRALAYNCRSYSVHVTARSSSPLFPGYGVRAVSCLDMTQGSLVALAAKPVRDLAYSHHQDSLLACSLDGSLRVVQRGTCGTRVQAPAALWSCTWHVSREHEVYAGAAGGRLLHYDLRQPGSPLATLVAPGDLSPVVSVCSTEHGVLSCQLNSCYVWSGEETRPLPVQGSLMSLSYCAASGLAAVGARAGVTVLRLGAGGARLETRFPGGGAGDGVLRRARLLSAGAAGGALATWAALYGGGALQLHGVGGVLSASLASAAPVLDAVTAALPGASMLAALTDTRLRIYTATPHSVGV